MGRERRTDSVVGWSRMLVVHKPLTEGSRTEKAADPTSGPGTFTASSLCHLASAYSPSWFTDTIYHLPWFYREAPISNLRSSLKASKTKQKKNDHFFRFCPDQALKCQCFCASFVVFFFSMLSYHKAFDWSFPFLHG